jgi:hypothetical protein
VEIQPGDLAMSFKEWVAVTLVIAAGLTGTALFVYMMNCLGAAIVGAF